MFKNSKGKRKRSRYSDFKEWCAERHIPVLLFPIAITTLVGVFLILIGGPIAGWNIAKALRSKTAYLFYIVGAIFVGYVAYATLNKRNQR